MIFRIGFALLFSVALASGQPATDISLGTFTVEQYGLNQMHFWNDPQHVVQIDGVTNLDSQLRWNISDNIFYFSPYSAPAPLWRLALENNSMGIVYTLNPTAWASATASESVAGFFVRHHGSGTCPVYVWVGAVGWYPGGRDADYWGHMGWQPAFPPPTGGLIPQGQQGEMHYLGEIELTDWVITSNLGAPPIVTPDRKIKGTFDYKNPNPVGGDPVRVRISDVTGEETIVILEPGQSVSGQYVGTVAGDDTAGGGHPSVVVEKYGGDTVDPDTGKISPKWIDPQVVPVDVSIDEELNSSETPRETEVKIDVKVHQGAPESGEPPPGGGVPTPPEGETSPNPPNPPPSDPDNPEPPNENPNPNLDAINTTIKSGNTALSNIEVDLDEIIRIMRKKEALEDQMQKEVEVGVFARLKQLISRTVDYTFKLIDNPAGVINDGINAMKSALTSVWSGFPGYSQIAGWAGVMSSARGYEAPTGIIPRSLPFTIMNKTFSVPLPVDPVIKMLNVIKIVVSALAIAFYYKHVYQAFMAAFAIAYSSPGSTGATTVEAKPSIAGWSIGSLKAPVIMLILGMVVIMAVNSSLFAIMSLRAESDQNFLSFLGNLQGSLGDFINAASSVSVDVGNTSINIGGGLLELIGAAVPIGLLFSFVLLGPVYVFITIYLPCAVVGAAILWYARSLT